MNKTEKAPEFIEPTFSGKGQQTIGCRPHLLSVPLLAAWTSMHRVTLEATVKMASLCLGP